jgi:hypothetical protein
MMRTTGVSLDASQVQADDLPKDNIVSVVAVGILAYASADIAHHVLGHGGACLALGGQIVSVSSIFVDCTVKGTLVDLAGPLGNVVVGVPALLGAMHASGRSSSPTLKLLLSLVAGFNLLWFAMQMAFSVATLSDDFAWPLHEFQVGLPVRLALIMLGALGYFVVMRLVAVALVTFARPGARLRRLMRVCWLAAGLFACITAILDPHPISAVLRHAAPQSFVLAIGLLIIPALKPQSLTPPASRIRLSIPLVAAAIATAVASVVLLGPGFSMSL